MSFTIPANQLNKGYRDVCGIHFSNTYEDKDDLFHTFDGFPFE